VLQLSQFFCKECCFSPPFLLKKAAPLKLQSQRVKKYAGYLNFCWDENAGKIWLEIDKLYSELLYQGSLPTALGPNDIGLDRGLPLSSFHSRPQSITDPIK